jgi:hypothetical protein
VTLPNFRSSTPPLGSSRVGGVNVDAKGIGTVEILTPIVSSHIIRRTVHALYTLDLTSRSAQHIGRLLISGSWLQTHSGCEFLFLADIVVGLLMVPT